MNHNVYGTITVFPGGQDKEGGDPCAKCERVCTERYREVVRSYGRCALMVSGHPFSPREIETIETLAPSMFPKQIAPLLSSRFAEDNGGSRSYLSVTDYIRIHNVRREAT